jgi:hypothetical protein
MKYLLLMTLLFGCSQKTTGAITGFENLNKGECVWAQVSEKEVTSLLALPISSRNLSFDDQLYYCCPSKDSEKSPVCREAFWVQPVE